MFDYPFPFTHFSCRAISFCSYKYTNPSSGSFVSANTLPLIRRFPFHGVGEYFSPGEKYFVFLKKEMAAGFYTFLISRDICSPISYYFPKLFSQAFPEDRLSAKMLTWAFILCAGYYFISLVCFCSFFFWVLLKALFQWIRRFSATGVSKKLCMSLLDKSLSLLYDLFPN